MSGALNFAIQLVSAFVGSFAFCALFGVKGRKLLWGAAGGMLSWAIYLIIGLTYPNDVISYLASSFVITIYVEIVSRIKKTPTTVFLVSSLIPLIPGGSLFYTMQHALRGEYTLFAQRGLYTLAAAGTLALGILFASSLTRPVFALLSYKNSKKKRG